MRSTIPFGTAILATFCLTATFSACSSDTDGTDGTKAAAQIMPTMGNTVEGTAAFEQAGSQVKLTVTLDKAPPGDHGFHIHAVGSCDDNGNAAMGHWNPDTKMHGKFGENEHHLGDVGNVTVGADGKGTLTMMTDKWTIGTGATNDVVGKSVIVHANVDDFMTQPTGDAGGRIGCGVIAKQ
jgi:superoxide dismutase, Cu-Zn family